MQFVTFAYNEATRKGADIYVNGDINDLTLVNSIIYDADALAETQIFINGALPTTYRFDNNIYTNYTKDISETSDIATMIAAGSGNIVVQKLFIHWSLNLQITRPLLAMWALLLWMGRIIIDICTAFKCAMS